MECYFTSIGRNTNLLIGMVIDPCGLVPEADKLRFAEFGDRMKRILSNRVAVACDTGSSLSLRLPEGIAPNMLMLMEDIAQGERVRKFVIEGSSMAIGSKSGQEPASDAKKSNASTPSTPPN